MKSQKILVAPLDWGLGHSTRCVPIILQLLEEGHEVILAANGVSAAFLKSRFPHLTLLTDIPAYDITYPENGRMLWFFLRESGRLQSVIKEEHRWLDQKIDELGLDQVYSDNRYGLYSKKVKCQFITHQLFLRAPRLLRWIANIRIKQYIKKYDACLIPDYGGTQNLSGALSHASGLPANVRYIGPLSRFTVADIAAFQSNYKYSFLAIISGPEPQRTILQEKLEVILKSIDRPSLIVCGQPDKQFDVSKGNLRIVSHLPDNALAEVILNSKTIICRAGYSTIMDLHLLKRMAVIIPTPGQTEQEYLGHFHHLAKRHVRIHQKSLTVEKIIQAHKRISFHNVEHVRPVPSAFNFTLQPGL